jgi:hypothetical protein
MMKYRLLCDRGHEFDFLFDNSAQYDEMKAAGHLMCGHGPCTSTEVTKAIMAPNVARGTSSSTLVPQEINPDNYEDVGQNFADVIRSGREAERPAIGFKGIVTLDEVGELAAEGYDITLAPSPLPSPTLN